MGKFWDKFKQKPMTELQLLKGIYDRLGWAIVWLFFITLAVGVFS